MPQLSPTMKSGTILKWHVSPSQLISAYELVLDIAVTNLTSNSSEISNMEIEIVEGDMYVACILAEEGKIRDVGSPLAILVEEPQDVEDIQRILKEGESMPSFNLPYDHSVAMWQAYVKSKQDAGACGCS